MTTRFSHHRSAASDDFESAQLARFLYRPIVFQEPDRIVHPQSWLEHVPFAFWIVDALRPNVFVELGTHSGNSYAAFAQAVQTLALPTSCYAVDTWQGDAHAGFYAEDVFTEWSAYHDTHFSAFSRLIRSTFAEAADHFSDGTVDLLHMDGYHTYESITTELRLWRPKLSRRAVILLHDINVRERDFGAWRLWEELRATAPHFEFLHGHGLGVLAAGADLPEPLEWLLSQTPSGEHVNAIRQFFARMGGIVLARAAVATLQGKDAERALELDEQSTAAHHQWQVSAQLQDVVRNEIEQRRHLGEEVQERHAAVARLTDELAEERSRATGVTLERDRMAEQANLMAAQLSKLELERSQMEEIARDRSRLAEQATLLTNHLSTMEAALAQETARTSELEGRLSAQQLSFDRATQQVAALRTRLRTEHSRRRDSGADPDRVPATSRRRVAGGGQGAISRLELRSRRALHRLRQISSTPAALGLLPATGRGSYRSAFGFLTHPARLRDAHIIATSNLFDEEYYARTYPDVAASRLTALAHYVLEGAREGRQPHPLFDGAYYLRCNPDVALARLNPLVHYRRRGALEGRHPHALFDATYYLHRNPDVRNSGVEPLSHFLRFGAADGRNPNPFFDCAYYLQRYPDVAAHRTNPLLHFVSYGASEGRRTSPAFDTSYYVAHNPDIPADVNPLAHYLEHGRPEGRRAVPDAEDVRSVDVEPVDDLPEDPPVTLRARSLVPQRTGRPTLLCLSHVMPLPPRAGNEYRIFRMLSWLRDQGYRIVLVIAPLPGERVERKALQALADEFSNVVLCDRDGQIEYVLRDVPDVLATLDGELTAGISPLLDEDPPRNAHVRELQRMDRTFCHDVLIATALRLHDVLGQYVLLGEYIWMSRIMPLIPRSIPKVIDTIDVFSTKRDKVLRFGIDDLHVERGDEAARLKHADLIIAIQEGEGRELQQLMPHTRVVTAGVDIDTVPDLGPPSGRRVLYVASDNPMNRKGLLDFLRFAWPHIRREVPDAELLLAGRISTTLDTDVAGVTRLGPVPDLKPLYEQARVIINPAVAGTGLKIKTIEALGHFRPIVTWPSGIDGFAPELARMCVTVEDWYEFSRSVIALLASETPRIFSTVERDAISRLTSRESTYRAMTDAIGDLWEQRFGSTVAGQTARE